MHLSWDFFFAFFIVEVADSQIFFCRQPDSVKRLSTGQPWTFPYVNPAPSAAKLKYRGDQALAVAAQRLLNNIPFDICMVRYLWRRSIGPTFVKPCDIEPFWSLISRQNCIGGQRWTVIFPALIYTYNTIETTEIMFSLIMKIVRVATSERDTSWVPSELEVGLGSGMRPTGHTLTSNSPVNHTEKFMFLHGLLT